MRASRPVEAGLTIDEARRLLSRVGFLEGTAAEQLGELARRAAFSRLEAGLALARALADRPVWMEDRWADVAAKGVTARLAGILMTLADEEGVMTSEGPMIPTRYTHRQLASMIGANREATTRALGELREAGAVELRGRRVRRGARGVRSPAYFGSFLSLFRSPAFVGTGSG